MRHSPVRHSPVRHSVASLKRLWRGRRRRRPKMRGHSKPLLPQVLCRRHLRVVRHHRHRVVSVEKAVFTHDVGGVLQLLVLPAQLRKGLAHRLIGGTSSLELLLGSADCALDALLHPRQEGRGLGNGRLRLHQPVYDVHGPRTMPLQGAHGSVEALRARNLLCALSCATKPGADLVEDVRALFQLPVCECEKVLCLVRHGEQPSSAAQSRGRVQPVESGPPRTSSGGAWRSALRSKSRREHRSTRLEAPRAWLR